MLFTLNAASVMDHYQVALTRAEADESGYQWIQMLNEFWRPPEALSEDPWDIAWALGALLQERALARSTSPRRRQSPSG